MQQINLYQDQFKPQREIPWLLILITTFCVLFVAMVIVSLSQQRTLKQAENRLHAEQIQVEQLRESTNLLQQQLAERSPSESLKSDLQLLRVQLSQRQPLQAALKQAMDQENTIPQSLEAFAAKPLKQLWLRKITLTDSGRTIHLQGLAQSAENIPMLIEGFSAQAVFSQQQFSQLELERQPEGLYQFLLSTQRGGHDGDGE